MADLQDPQSLDNRKLSAIARNPSHPMHTHAKSELDRRRMKQEKTLTPAEIRKRDKIAKAIKKDDPDMPMDKKMAIATATAKRVAEVSSNTLSNYMRKSAADVSKSRGDARRQDKRIGGQKMADDKIRKKMGYSSQAKVPAGTNEVLDTPKAMQSYKDKAKYSKDKATNSAVANILRKGDHTDDLKTRAKRVKGLGMADRNATKKTVKALRKEESVNEAATPAMKKAADELNSYAKKSGGIDKADFMKTAKMLSTGKAGMSLIKFVDGQDTDVYEKILTVMAKHMGKQTIEKMFKVKVREEVESVNELSKDTMQSYWDKTKGDDAFSGSRKANNRLKGAINVTTKLDKLKKMVNKNKK